MFSIGISKPKPFKNSYIAGAESTGLAVKTNIFLLPNFSIAFLSLGTKGPAFPSTTLLNSEKSKTQPSASISLPFSANSAAFILNVLPF